MNLTKMNRARRRMPRGFSLMEVMIAATLFTMASGIAMSTFVYTARMGKAQRTQVMLAQNALNIGRTMKSRIQVGNQLSITNNGRTLDMEAGQGATLVRSRIWFTNGDGSDSTVWNNSLRWDPNLAVNGDEETFATGIAPVADGGGINPNGAIFTLPNGSGRGVRIRFRMGDQTGGSATDDGAHSGVGRQTYVYDSIFSIRNNKT